MVNLTLNKQRLLADLGVQESEDLYHQFAMMGIEVESRDGGGIVVDITPNRPDLLSQAGVTRALAAFLGLKPGLREYQTAKSKLKVRVDPSTKDIRPYTACAVVKDLKFDDEKIRELVDIQEKLHVTFCRQRKRAAIGAYPMESIVGNITFKALPPKDIKFRPLEAAQEMTAPEILKSHPKGKEFAHLLEGLPLYPIFVDSKDNVLSLTPVINSHLTGKVTEKTKEIFIEASGHDFRICHEIVRMMCAALADMGGTVQTVDVVYGKRTETTPDMAPSRQQFFGYYVNRRLGTNLKKEEFPKLLARMGLGFEDGRIKETHYALIPPYRVDFLHQIDVVEDIGIAHGYESLTPTLSEMTTVASESAGTLFGDKLRNILSGYGLLEAKNYHLLGKAFQNAVREDDLVTLKSSVSEEYDALRASLLSCLLHTLRINKLHEYPQQLFELGTVFRPLEEDVEEQTQLATVLAGSVDYTRIRQLVDGLLLGLGLQGTFVPHEDARFLAGRCAALRIDGKHVGVLGEVAPRVLAAAELNVPVAACELDADLLRKFALRS